MFEVRISELSGPAKLFVGLFTSLMVLVSLWAILIFYIEKGLVTVEEPYESYQSEVTEAEDPGLQEEIDEILADPESELAPDWDTLPADTEDVLDAELLAEGFRHYDSELAAEAEAEAEDEYYGADGGDHFRHNLGLAHTHINGMTLLFFALGLVFLFTSTRSRRKKIVLWTFAAAVVIHAIGLTGEGFHWFYDDVLAVSGVVILVMILYMALLIYIDLGRKPSKASAESEE